MLEERLTKDPAERLFAMHIARLWRETMWLEKTGHFANGKPLNEQFWPELLIIETFLAALVRRQEKLMRGALDQDLTLGPMPSFEE